MRIGLYGKNNCFFSRKNVDSPGCDTIFLNYAILPMRNIENIC